MCALPVFLADSSTLRILAEAKDLVPNGTEVFLFGGSVRNAVVYAVSGKKETQRDYDCLVIGDG